MLAGACGIGAEPVHDVTVTAARAPNPVAATSVSGGTAAAEPLAPLSSEGAGAGRALVPPATTQTAGADTARGDASRDSPPLTAPDDSSRPVPPTCCGGSTRASPPLTSTDDSSDEDSSNDDSSSARGEAEIDRAEFPEATFPEASVFPDASVRDSEAEAADLERRRSVIGLFERLRVEAERRGGYRRDAVFPGWLYSAGQSTRDGVLSEEQLANGTWLSAYDASVVAASSELDIDHLVPLAEAWESGGHEWAAETWTRFANDRADPRSLIAVSAATNRSKGARDPAEWWPPSSSYRCQYAVDWIAVKTRWDLAVDADEQESLDVQLGQCAGADFAFSAPAPALVVRASTARAPTETTLPATGRCHPAYQPCIPHRAGDALNCGDLSRDQRPVYLIDASDDPYRFDRDGDGIGCQ